MKLSSYEFEIISLCYKGPFAYAKDFLTCVKNSHKIWMCFFVIQTFTKCFQILYEL
jgi:hypothetical protein